MEKTPNIVCIIQARMGSSRLPGKVLKEICDRSMLGWVTRRAAQSQRATRIVVATTVNSGDDPIEEFCKKSGFACFRGNEFDVLDRYYQAAKAYDAGIVVRLTADCPLIDPALVDETIEQLIAVGADFAANRLPPPYKRTYPIGLDVEVATFAALETAWKQAEKPFEREHVMPFLYDPQNHFKTIVLDAEDNYGSLRWTVDTADDLEFIRQVTAALNCRMDFSWRDVIKVLDEHPELEAINAGIEHKSYNDVDHRANLNRKD
ncbi:MAG: glycosyltransferase family protein [Anaerolineaceae bacterium]|nr:glycosyltransferase family protein [Anaerolineaceae bacterium]